jgi:hypothetical protein
MKTQNETKRFGQELPIPARLGPKARSILARIQGPAPAWAGFVWTDGHADNVPGLVVERRLAA